MDINLFQTLYDLLNTYLFGGAIVPDTYADLVCIIASVCGVLFVASLPFVVVYKLITVWMR